MVGQVLTGSEHSSFIKNVTKALDKLAKLRTGAALIDAIDQSGHECHIFSGGKLLGYDGCAQPLDTRSAQQEVDRMVKPFRPRLQNLLVRERDRTANGGQKTYAEKYWEKKFKEHLGYDEELYAEAIAGELHVIMGRLSAKVSDPWKFASQLTDKTIKELVDISLGRATCDDSTYYKICFLFYDHLTPGPGISTQVRLTPQIAAEGLASHWWRGNKNFQGDWTAAREDIMVGHELVHAWRMMVGRRVVRGGWEEEAMTVGLSFAAGWPFTENQLRLEAGHPRRIKYDHSDFSSAYGMDMKWNGFQ